MTPRWARVRQIQTYLAACVGSVLADTAASGTSAVAFGGTDGHAPVRRPTSHASPPGAPRWHQAARGKAHWAMGARAAPPPSCGAARPPSGQWAATWTF
eukprot:scaffold54317_cov59-Phaeocystis_antarctica.AAC.4